MSQRAAASEPFVPFDPLPGPAARPSAAPVGLKVMPKADAPPGTPASASASASASAFAPLQSAAAVSAHAHANSTATGKPVVTLQREGERVTGIRIECPCGQVIELACSY